MGLEFFETEQYKIPTFSLNRQNERVDSLVVEKSKRLNSIDDTNIIDQGQKFVGTAIESSSGRDISDWVSKTIEGHTFNKVNNDFVNFVSDEDNVAQMANDFSVPYTPEIHKMITSSNTIEEAEFLLNIEFFKEINRDVAKQSISEIAITTANITGSILSPETLLIAPLAIAAKAKKISALTALGAEATIYSIGVLAKENIDPNYTKEEATSDLLLGALITAPFAVAALRAKNLTKARANIVSDPSEIQDEIKLIEFKPLIELPKPKPIKSETIIPRNLQSEIDASSTIASKKDLSFEIKNSIKDLDPTSANKAKITKAKAQIKQLNDGVIKIKLANKKVAKDKITKEKIALSSLSKQEKKEAELMAGNFGVAYKKLEDELSLVQDIGKNKVPSKVDIDNVNELISDVLSSAVSKSKSKRITQLLDYQTGKLKGSNLFRLRQNKDGSYTAALGKGKDEIKIRGKIPAVIALSLLGATAANASDGAIVSNEGILIAVALIIGGIGAIKAVKNYGGIKNSLQSFTSTIAKKTHTAKVKASNQSYSDSVDDITDSMRTGATEAYTSIAKHGKLSTNLANKLLHNVLDGRELSASQVSEGLTRKYSVKFSTSNRQNYKDFLNSEGIGYADRITSYVGSSSIKGEFDLYVGKLLSGIDIEPSYFKSEAGYKSAIKEAKSQRKLYDEFLQEASDAGIKVKGLEKYFPRLENFDARGLVRGLDDTGIVSLKAQFHKMVMAKMKSPDAKKADSQVKEYITRLLEPRTSSFRLNDEIVNDLAEQVLRSTDDADVAKKINDDLLERMGKKGARFRNRIDLDLNQFESFDAVVNGKNIKVGIEQIFDLDSSSVFNRYTHNASGHIALAKVGYTKMSKLANDINIVEKSESIKSAKSLRDIQKAILGEPLLDPTAGGTAAVSVIRNMTTATFMGLGTLTMTGEALRTLVRTGTNGAMMTQAFNDFTGVITRQGKDSELTSQLMDYFGHGQTRNTVNLNFRGFNDLSNTENMMSGSLVKATAVMRDGVLIGSQMIRVHDYLSKINMVGNMQDLAKVVRGEKKLSKDMMIKFGITEDTIDMFKDSFDINSVGALKKVDKSSWSVKKNDEFRKVMENMQEKYIQNSTLGGSPLWGKNSELGAALSPLISFPLQAYANHGLQDLKGVLKGDLESYANMTLWLVGGYTTAKLRAELSGNELTNEELMLRAFNNLPLTGIASLTGLPEGGAGSAAAENLIMMKDLLDAE